MERPTGRVRTIATIATIVMVAASLGACGSDGPIANLRPGTTIDGGGGPAPTDAPPATDNPPATEAPAPSPTEAPAPTDAPATPDPDPDPLVPDTDTGTDTDTDEGVDLLVVLLIVGGLALVAILIGFLVSRSGRSRSAAAPSANASTQSSLLSTSQWITDQLSLELMAAPSAQAQQRWSVERSRLDNVAIGAQQQYLEAQDANWQPLAQTMSALAAALDTNLTLRAQDPPNAQLIDESTAVVNRHRGALQQLIAALRPTVTR